MKVVIEQTFVGPLNHKPTRRALLDAVERAKSLDEADTLISQINGLSTYRGGSHIAVHPSHNGRFAKGSERVAIVTED